jgi:hypothetical protein
VFQPRQVQFGVGMFEPVFCTAYLVDIDNHLRASEDFVFDLNDDRHLAFMGPNYVVCCALLLFLLLAL